MSLTLGTPSTSMRRTLPGGAPVRAVLGSLLILWIVLPLIPVLLWAVAGEWRAPSVVPTSYSFRGLTGLATAETGWAAASSLALGTVVAAIATPLGYLGALAVRRTSRMPSRVVELLLLAPLAIPPFALVMGANVTLLRWHVPAFLGIVLILVVTALPFTAFMFRSALASYDERYDEVARSLGATSGQTWRNVRVPLLVNASSRAFFLAFLVGWGDYIATLLIGGGVLRTLPMMLASAASSTGNEQLTAALSLAILIPPMILLTVLVSPTVRRRRPP